MAKSSDRQLTSHPQRTSLMTINFMHKAVQAFNENDLVEFTRLQVAFIRKLNKAKTYKETYSPLESIQYKGENTSVFATAHKLAEANPFMQPFELIIEGTFPEDAALSRRVDEVQEFEENSKNISNANSLTQEDMDRVYSKDDDEPDTSEYYNAYKAFRYKR